MENTALLLIGISILLLIIILILVAFLFYTMLKDKNKNAAQNTPVVPTNDYHPEIIDRMETLKKVKKNSVDLFCPNHVEEPGEVTCAICDHLFCKSCVRPYKTFHLCKEHLPLVMKYEWEEVITIKTSTHDPERGVRLYDIKKDLFNDEHHSTYVETHYKINVENDYIETYLVMFAIKDEVKLVKEFIENRL